MEFVITAASGESVTVASENWMVAMGKAMAFFRMDATSMIRWVCTAGPAGEVSIEDPVAERGWTIKPLVPVVKIVAVAPPVDQKLAGEVPPTPEEAEALDAPRRPRDDEPMPESAEPPPMFQMPLKTSFEPPPMPEPSPEDEKKIGRRPTASGEVFNTEDVAERVFDLSMDLAGSEPAEACQKALDLILELVPCEAASVVRGATTDFEMAFAAARGPISEKIVGRTHPFGQGLLGMCYDANVPVQVNDAQADDRHDKSFDEEFGFTTKSLLCVPVSNESGTYGVVQLINPEDPFTPEMVDAVQMIARTLAENLALQY